MYATVPIPTSKTPPVPQERKQAISFLPHGSGGEETLSEYVNGEESRRYIYLLKGEHVLCIVHYWKPGCGWTYLGDCTYPTVTPIK